MLYLSKEPYKSMFMLLHYWSPIGLGWSIALVIHQATGMPIIPAGLHLYLFGICAAYSIDRLIDKPDTARPLWLTTVLVIGFLVSTLFGLYLAIHLSIQTLSALVLFSSLTLLYPRVKKLPFVKGIFVAVVWGWAGVALPFTNSHWFAWQFWRMEVSLPVVLLVACDVILCDFKDIKTDHLHGVQSLPAMLGKHTTRFLVSISLVIAAIISFQENRMGLVTGSVFLLILAQFPKLLSLDAIGPIVVDLSLTVPGFLIVLHLI